MCAVCLSRVIDKALLETLSGQGDGEPSHSKRLGYAFPCGRTVSGSSHGLATSDTAFFEWFCLSNSVGGFRSRLGHVTGCVSISKVIAAKQ